VYDGDCRFCISWIKRWQKIAGNHVDFLPYQDSSIASRFPEILLSQFENAVQLIEPQGVVFSGARAALGALAHRPFWARLLGCYEKYPWFAGLAESSYRFVARHRGWFSRFT
jgi:predicted DCC family thiol-disulfide oxidoreductase YuxK